MTRGALVVALLAAGCTCGAPAVAVTAAKRPRDLDRPQHGLSDEDARRVLARIDEREVTLLDFVDAVERMRGSRRLRAVTPEERTVVLDRLLDDELLADEARRRGLDAHPRVVAARREALRRVFVAHARELVRAPDPDPELVRARYDAEPARWRQPELVRARAIRLSDRALAEQTLAELREADDLDRAMHRLTVERSVASAGFPPEGRLGPFAAAELARPEDAHVPAPLRRAAFATSPGQLHPELVEADGYVHVVRALSRELEEEEIARRVEARALRGRTIRVEDAALRRVAPPAG